MYQIIFKMRLIQLFVIAFAFHQIHGFDVEYAENVAINAPEITNFKCGEKEAMIIWKPYGNSETIKHYTIEYSTSFEPNVWSVFADKIRETSHVVSLSPGATFTFRVIQTYENGKSSPPSESTELCTTKPDVPYINPTNVQVKSASKGTLLVSWTAMPQLEHNAPGFFYLIYRRKEGFKIWKKEVTIADWKQDQYIIKMLSDVNYEIKVVSGNELGESKAESRVIVGNPGENHATTQPPIQSTTSTPETTTNLPPNAPTITDLKCEEKSATISWEQSGNTANIKHYTIEFSTKFTPNEWAVAADKVIEKSHTVSMSPGSEFTFRVIAIDENGQSSAPSKSTEMCTTKPDVPYTNPTNVEVKSASKGALHVSWTPMPQLEHNAPGFFYLIYRRKEGFKIWKREITIADWKLDQYIIKMLSDVNYEIKVVAGNELGESKAEPQVIVGNPGENHSTTQPTTTDGQTTELTTVETNKDTSEPDSKLKLSHVIIISAFLGTGIILLIIVFCIRKRFAN